MILTASEFDALGKVLPNLFEPARPFVEVRENGREFYRIDGTDHWIPTKLYARLRRKELVRGGWPTERAQGLYLEEMDRRRRMRVGKLAQPKAGRRAA